jgi:hypothetical protein
MPESISSIENLSKVSLRIHANTSKSSDEKGSLFTFIFGASPAGYTGIEKALYGKCVGDQLDFEIAQADFCETIGYLANSLREQTGIHGPTSLHVTVKEITRAEDREVVQAMAGSGSCGDCDCGCGGH